MPRNSVTSSSLQTDVEQQRSQVLLRGDRLGEHDRLAAAAAVAAEIEDHPNRVLKRARLGIVRQRSRAGDEALDTSQLASDRLAIDRGGRFLDGFLDLVFVLEVAEHRRSLFRRSVSPPRDGAAARRRSPGSPPAPESTRPCGGESRSAAAAAATGEGIQ